MDNFPDMSAEQVLRQEARLREAAQHVRRQVKDAQDAGSQLPWMSRDTGVDMSYEFERWRRWNRLCDEMARSGAEVVAALGPSRVAYWIAALNEDDMQPAQPLSAFRPVTPIVRRVDPPRPRSPLRPSD